MREFRHGLGISVSGSMGAISGMISGKSGLRVEGVGIPVGKCETSRSVAAHMSWDIFLIYFCTCSLRGILTCFVHLLSCTYRYYIFTS